MARLGLRVINHVLPISLPFITTSTTPQLEATIDVEGLRLPVTTNTFEQIEPTIATSLKEEDQNKREERHIEEIGGDERGTRVELEGTEPCVKDFDEGPTSFDERRTRVELEGTELCAEDFENMEEVINNHAESLLGEDNKGMMDTGGNELMSSMQVIGEGAITTSREEIQQPPHVSEQKSDIQEDTLQDKCVVDQEQTKLGTSVPEKSPLVSPTHVHYEESGPELGHEIETHPTLDQIVTSESNKDHEYTPSAFFVESPLVSRAHAQEPTKELESTSRSMKVHDLSTVSSHETKSKLMEPAFSNDNVRSASSAQGIQDESMTTVHTQEYPIQSVRLELDPSMISEENTPKMDTPIGSSDKWGIGFSSDEEMSDMDEDDTFDTTTAIPSYLQQNIVKAVYYAIGQ